MILYACAVYDSATEAYARPFFCARPAEAIRSFTDEVNRPADPPNVNQLNRHPSDYSLCQLGIWDDNTGEWNPDLRRLCRAQDVFAPPSSTPDHM